MLEGLEAKEGVRRLLGSREAQIQPHFDILQDATRSADAYTRETAEARRMFRVLESVTFRSMKTRHENIDTAHDKTLDRVFHQSKIILPTWLTGDVAELVSTFDRLSHLTGTTKFCFFFFTA